MAAAEKVVSEENVLPQLGTVVAGDEMIKEVVLKMRVIFGIFYFLPWWLKIIIIFIILSIPVAIVQSIRESIGRKAGRTKISQQMSINPEAALQTAIKSYESNAFSLDEYENQLIKIAESTGYIDAMVKLTELYAGEKYKGKKDEAKSKFWMKRAAEAGDVSSIMDYYGFLDYDFSSDSYNEILQDLEKVRVTSEEERFVVNYLKGIVYYKLEQIDTAKQLFANMPDLEDSELGNGCKYMLFRCLIKESNVTAAAEALTHLEAAKFEVPADGYLSMYNYYANERNHAEADYAAELKFFQKYSACKDADKKTIQRIGGSIYYNIAVALQNGRNGFEEDIGKAQEAYRKAADFGHVESSYCAGLSFWTSEYRDYHKANEYLLKAARNGHKQAETILEQYGVDGILIAPKQADKVTYQFMDSFKLTASDSIMKWLSLCYGIQYKAVILSDQFLEQYSKNFHSFEELVNGIHQLYAIQVAQMLSWSIQLLMSCGIDTYDANDIINASEDLALLPRVPSFEQALEKIDERAEHLNMKTAYAQATRGYWSGAGFGTTIKSTISASAKASVAAGVMNIGSGVLHGIGDSIVGAMNNAEIRDMGKRVFDNPNTIKVFDDAVLSACFDIGTVVRRIIENHSNVKLEALEGTIKFGNENLADIDERSLNAKINNNLSVANNEYAYALLIEKLRRHPLNRDAFDQIIDLTIERSSYGSQECKEALRYACDFKLEGRATELYNFISSV